MGCIPTSAFVANQRRQSRKRERGRITKAVSLWTHRPIDRTQKKALDKGQKTSERGHHTGECGGGSNTVTTHGHRDINEYNGMKREQWVKRTAREKHDARREKRRPIDDNGLFSSGCIALTFRRSSKCLDDGSDGIVAT